MNDNKKITSYASVYVAGIISGMFTLTMLLIGVGVYTTWIAR